MLTQLHHENIVNGIRIVNVCNIGIPAGATWEESCAYVKDWCKANDAAYYGAPREDFSYHAAVSGAKAAGKTIVVVDDLS